MWFIFHRTFIIVKVKEKLLENMWIKVIVWGVFFLLLGIFLIGTSLNLQSSDVQYAQSMSEIGKPIGYLFSAVGIIAIVVGIKFPDRWK